MTRCRRRGGLVARAWLVLLPVAGPGLRAAPEPVRGPVADSDACTNVQAPGSWIWDDEARRAVVEVLPDTSAVLFTTWSGLEGDSLLTDTVFAALAVVDRPLPGWGRLPDTVSLVPTVRDPECRLHPGTRLEPGRRYLVVAHRRPDALNLGRHPSFEIRPGPGPRLSPSDAPHEAAVFVEWFDMMRRLPTKAAWEEDCVAVVGAVAAWAEGRYPGGPPPYPSLADDFRSGCEAWTESRPPSDAPSSETRWWAGLDTLPPGLHLWAFDSLYAIVADDAPTAALQMDLYGPEVDGEPFYGLHRGAWRYDYRLERIESGCRASAVTVLLRSVITLPHLANYDVAPGPLRRQWDTYLPAVRLHEEGHRTRAMDVMRRFLTRVGEVSADDCEAVRSVVTGLQDEAAGEWRRVQDAYDEETDHGRTQGAYWSRSGRGG